MTKPPSNAPVLFNIDCDKSTITRGKNDSFKMVMEGIDNVCWKTSDLSNQSCFATKKFAKSFEDFYGNNPQVASYETYKTDNGTKDKIKFTISSAKFKKKSNKLVFQIKPLNNNQADKITGITNKSRANTSMHSKDPTYWFPDLPFESEGLALNNYNFSYAVFREPDLNGANLSGADLSHSITDFGDMSNINLSQANLTNAIFWGVDLIDANLRGANLSGTEFLQVDMSGADLTGAINADSSRFFDIEWSNLTCPNGSKTSGSYLEWFDGVPYFIPDTCSGEQLFPLA